MLVKAKLYRMLSAGAVALVTGAAVQAVAADPAQAQIACPTGYVCLDPMFGPPVLIPAGERRTFSDGLPVDGTVNGTHLGYCVTSAPYNYGLPPKGQTARRHTVFRVGPGEYCPL